MGHLVKGLAIRLFDYLAGSTRVAERQADTDDHRHWDRDGRAWSNRRPEIG